MAMPALDATSTPASTAFASVLALISSAVGAGVLSFPYAFRSTGWLAGLIAVGAIAAAEGFTLYVVSRMAEYTKQRSYAALVHTMLGRGFSLLMCAVMILYPFGSCIAYLVICGDSFQPLLHNLFGAAWFTSRAAIIAGVGCTCILPLCFRTRLGALKAVSSLCVWGLLVVVGIVVLRSAEIVSAPGHSWEAVRAINSDSPLEFLSALVIFVFGFHSHTNVVSIFEELEAQPSLFRSGTSTPSLAGSEAVLGSAADAVAAAGAATACGGAANGFSRSSRQRRPKSEKLLGMIHVVMAGLAVTAVLYTCVGMSAYLAFPATARSDIMLNFDASDHLVTVARAAIGLIMVAAYPINHHPARIGIHDLLLQTAGRSYSGPLFVAVETIAFFTLTLGIALRCSDLGRILKLVGGTCGAVLIFLMPGALLVSYAHSKHRESCQRQQQHAAAAAATALEAQLGAPLLGQAGEAAGSPLFCLWCSKHFWAGVLLIMISAGLMVLTVITSLHPMAIN